MWRPNPEQVLLRQKRIQNINIKYSTQLQKQCCADGMVENLMDYTCERRAEFIIDGAECVSAFLHCCKEAATNRQKAANENLLLARCKPHPQATNIQGVKAVHIVPWIHFVRTPSFNGSCQ
uniref:Anaphylatoxin-like domain-containing protein n=1 Tax=Paramormyrops kingsleyae TaxID=1676925 RepID=A0A3B3RZJ7_9TELE